MNPVSILAAAYSFLMFEGKSKMVNAVLEQFYECEQFPLADLSFELMQTIVSSPIMLIKSEWDIAEAISLWVHSVKESCQAERRTQAGHLLRFARVGNI